jgi:hypothetical protein
LLLAMLTPEDLDVGVFMAALAVVHLCFGFVYGNWWALTGSLLWLPPGLLTSGGSLAGGIGGAFLLMGVAAVLVAAGVGTRRLLLRGARWRALEQDIRLPGGALSFRAVLAGAVALAGLMWIADALTGSPLLVMVLAVIALVAVHAFGPRESGTPPPPLFDALVGQSVGQKGRRTVASVVLFCALAGAFLLLAGLSELLGFEPDSSEHGPPIGSATVWALALLLYAVQTERRIRTGLRPHT